MPTHGTNTILCHDHVQQNRPSSLLMSTSSCSKNYWVKVLVEAMTLGTPRRRLSKTRQTRVKGGGKGRGKAKGKGKINKVKGMAGFTEVEYAHLKLISTILTGMNRALLFIKIDAGDSGCDSIFPVVFPWSLTC